MIDRETEKGSDSKKSKAGLLLYIVTIIFSVLFLFIGNKIAANKLSDFNSGDPSAIDLKAIIFAAILIGAMGAIMDVSMSISSSLWEVKENADSSLKALFKSGMNIGRDIMGTMANTLILAYIGSALSVVLLLSAYNTSLIYILNREIIVVEILQALVGSFGILLTMPLTSLICAVIYTRKKQGFDKTSLILEQEVIEDK